MNGWARNQSDTYISLDIVADYYGSTVAFDHKYI